VVTRRYLTVGERRNLKIRGIVQGVFFRETVRRTASRYGVRGFVRNVGFDALEIEAEGEPKVGECVHRKRFWHIPAWRPY